MLLASQNYTTSYNGMYVYVRKKLILNVSYGNIELTDLIAKQALIQL
jgi:hypothetical protein